MQDSVPNQGSSPGRGQRPVARARKPAPPAKELIARSERLAQQCVTLARAAKLLRFRYQILLAQDLRELPFETRLRALERECKRMSKAPPCQASAQLLLASLARLSHGAGAESLPPESRSKIREILKNLR